MLAIHGTNYLVLYLLALQQYQGMQHCRDLLGMNSFCLHCFSNIFFIIERGPSRSSGFIARNGVLIVFRIIPCVVFSTLYGKGLEIYCVNSETILAGNKRVLYTFIVVLSQVVLSIDCLIPQRIIQSQASIVCKIQF